MPAMPQRRHFLRCLSRPPGRGRCSCSYRFHPTVKQRCGPRWPATGPSTSCSMSWGISSNHLLDLPGRPSSRKRWWAERSGKRARLPPSGGRAARSIDHEGDLEVDPVVDDLVVLDFNLLVADPGALDVLDGLAGALDPFPDCSFEALGRFGADFDDLGNGHGVPLSQVRTCWMPFLSYIPL